MEPRSKIEEIMGDLCVHLLEIKDMANRQPAFYSAPERIYLHDSSDTENLLLVEVAERMRKHYNFIEGYDPATFIVGLPTKTEFMRANGKGIYLYDLNQDLRSSEVISALAT